MNIKEKIFSFLKIGKTDTEEKVEKENTTSLELNSKVDDFITWYNENKFFGGYTDIGKYYKSQNMRDLIEKVAVWYELRYPEFEIITMDKGDKVSNFMNNIMFRKNSALANEFKKKLILQNLDWPLFYNFEVFVNSLSKEEMCYFIPLEYRKKINLYFNSKIISFHLSKNGIVEEIENLEYLPNFTIKAKELKGLHINKVAKILKLKGVELPKNNELDMEINSHISWDFLRSQILTCAMYRIIERGGKRIGPRRGLMFAKEFNLNIDIPMIYGVDESDPNLGYFILEYLKAGGSIDLVCLSNYFSKTEKNFEYKLILLESLIKLVINNLREVDVLDNINLSAELNSKLKKQQKLNYSNMVRRRKL